METVTRSLAELTELAERVLEANGCDRENARAVAATMIATERDVGRSHGILRLPGHVAMLRDGQVNGRARPRVERPAPGAVIVEGDGGFAPVAHGVGLPALAEAAAAQGVALLGIRRTVHFAGLWPEVAALGAQGLVALAMTSSPPYVAAPGGRRPFFGTNPLAFAWPRPDGEGGATGRGEPLVWDMATSAMARGEILLAAREGRSVPQGAGLDAEGRPTTDPRAILEGGAQLATGGVKGGLLALMVDLLAGPLLDEVTSLEAGGSAAPAGPAPGGEFLLAIDPGRLGAAAPRLARAERLLEALAAEEGARLPGASRLARRARVEAEGVAVPAALLAEIEALL